MKSYKSVEWKNDCKSLRLLDQTKLPGDVEYLTFDTAADIAVAIKDMIVRGAPAIGVTAAYGLAVGAFQANADDLNQVKANVREADALLRASRPTAVNLFWALDEVQRRLDATDPSTGTEYQQEVLNIAHQLAEEDVSINLAIANAAMDVVPADVTFIHHCNTGFIATMDYGTALGIIRVAHEKGKNVHVFVDETRPRLQGSKLTSWELKELGISHQIIVDGASGHVMQNNKVDMCVVGCDRVAINGDVANKIGTYNLAVVAKENGVPFYIAAPLSTIDPATSTGKEIEIELREDDGVCVIAGYRIAPEGVRTYNPAFDVTPAALITGIITEQGIIYPPYEEKFRVIFANR